MIFIYVSPSIEQPVHRVIRAVEGGIAGCDGGIREAQHEGHARRQQERVAASFEAVGMHVGQRHLLEVDGIGQDGFGLAVFVGRRGRVSLQRGCLGILLLVVLEVADEELDRSRAGELDLRPCFALRRAVDGIGREAHQFGSERLHLRLRHVGQQDGAFREADGAELGTGEFDCRGVQWFNRLCLIRRFSCGLVLESLEMGLEVGQLLLVVGEQFLPRLVLAIVAADGYAALGRLHAVGVKIVVFGQIHKRAVVFEALLQQRSDGIKVREVAAPLVVEHLLGGTHLIVEEVGKLPVAVHVVDETSQLVGVGLGLALKLVDGSHGGVTPLHAVGHDVERQFAHVRLALPLLLDILDELLALRAAALVEAGIDGVLVGVDELADEHAEEERLAVALRDAEAAQELGSYLARLFVGGADERALLVGEAVEAGKLAVPVGYLALAVSTAVPCVASPELIPGPVAVDLLLALSVGELVGGVGVFPIGGLGEEMERIGAVDIVHGLDGLLHEVGRRPAEGLEVGQHVDVLDVGRTQGGEVLVNLRPRAAGLVGGQRLAIVLVHRVEVLIQGQGGIHDHLAVRVVGTDEDGRFVGAAERLQSVLHAGDDGLGEPFDVVLMGVHGFAEADEQSDVGIGLDEGRDALARVVAQQGRDGSVAVLGLDAVVLRKGFGDEDVVELLYDEDAALVGLLGEEAVHLLVLLERLVVDLDGEGIVLQADERSEGMPVPEVEGVHTVVDEHVEIFHPPLLIVEPGEVLRRVGIFVDMASRQDEGLLHADARAAEHHLRGILHFPFGKGERAVVLQLVSDGDRTVDDTAGVIARDGGQPVGRGDGVSFLLQAVALGHGEDDDAVVRVCGEDAVERGVIACGVELLFESFARVGHAVVSPGRDHDGDSFLPATHHHERHQRGSVKGCFLHRIEC